MLEGAQKILSWAGGLIIAAGLVGVAAAMSVYQALNTHPNQELTMVLVATSLVAVGWECQAIARIRHAMAQGRKGEARWGRALLILAALYTGYMQYSLLSEAFDTRIANRETVVREKSRLLERRTSLQKKIAWLPERAASPEVIQQQIAVVDAKMQNELRSGIGPRFRGLKLELRQLKADLVGAKKREALEIALADVDTELSGLGLVRHADSTGALFSFLPSSGFDVSKALTAFVMLCLVAFVQLGQIFIGPLVFYHQDTDDPDDDPGGNEDEPERPPVQSPPQLTAVKKAPHDPHLAKYIERLRSMLAGEEISASEMYSRYKECREQDGLPPMPYSMFIEQTKEMTGAKERAKRNCNSSKTYRVLVFPAPSQVG